MIDDNFQDVIKELRGILSQIKGVKNIGEDFSLTYLIVTENEESKKDAEKVCGLLFDQAKEKYSLDMEYLVLTEDEVNEVKLQEN